MPPRDDARWEAMFSRLEAFRARNGHTEVPRFGEDKALGLWVNNQRSLHARGKLRPERAARLDAIGFAYSARDVRFERFFARLQAFARAHGHCAVPASHPDPELYRWLQVQRSRRDELSASQRRALEQLGAFERNARVQEALRWEHFYARLAALREQRGHCDVREPDCPRDLWFWVRRQRSAYVAGTLPKERERRLAALGFRFTPREEAWEDHFTELVRFRRAFRHCDVQATGEHAALGEWVIRQRKELHAGTLSADRVQRLESLGFRWRAHELPEERFARMLEKLVAFRAEHGHLRVPTRSWPDEELRSWVLRLRGLHSRGELPASWRARLEALGFVWDAREVAWEEAFAKLEAFRCEHGHAAVPKTHPDQTLAQWVLTQRAAKRAGTLRPDRAERLDALGFVWEAGPRPTPQLDEMRERLRQLPRTRSGRADLRALVDPSLRAWLSERRADADEGRLHPLVERELRALGLLQAPLEPETDEAWDAWAERLEAFRRLRGPVAPDPQSRLGAWLAAQRELARQEALAPRRVARLERLGVPVPRRAGRQ